MSAASRPRYTVEEYVRFEQHANARHEYVDGQIIGMGGGTFEHARLAVAVSTALAVQLQGKRCAVASSDARIRIQATGLITYPDVVGVCGNLEFDPDDPLAVTNPIVLAEVTSPSSEAYDRGEKFDHYKQIASLREYIIVNHRESRIEVHRRGDDGAWSLSEAANADPLTQRIVAITSIGCDLNVDDVYRDPLA